MRRLHDAHVAPCVFEHRHVGMKYCCERRRNALFICVFERLYIIYDWTNEVGTKVLLC